MKARQSLSKVCSNAKHEFVIYDSLCIAVRDRESGAWLDEHFAVDERVGLAPVGGAADPALGHALVVYTHGAQVWIGPVRVVDATAAAAAATFAVTRSAKGQSRAPKPDFVAR